MRLKIADLVIDQTIDIRSSLDEETITRYEESFDKLPPVDVFDTPDGLLLADGFHRAAAAQRLGLAEIEAKIHKGSRAEALEFAVDNRLRAIRVGVDILHGFDMCLQELLYQVGVSIEKLLADDANSTD